MTRGKRGRRKGNNRGRPPRRPIGFRIIPPVFEPASAEARRGAFRLKPGIENPYPAKIPAYLKGKFTQAQWEQAVKHQLHLLAEKRRASRRKTRRGIVNAWERISEMTPDQAEKFQQFVDETQVAMRKQEKERHEEAAQLAKKIFRPTPEFETIIRKHATITLTLEQLSIYENLLALRRMMVKEQNISGGMRASFIDVAERHGDNERRNKKILTSPRLWKAKVKEALQTLHRN